ncbi:polynucleotide phosphorylase/polyadenylase [Sulfitobacter indolifex HEL-45]|uniref:Polynucleotide phosphorylase/polyadenylase n=1 Tax=Sulfitobacter indolifex HEL-45 TaxID=391624 RepID=A0ABP2DE26_9RHOB|nr:polynucleotide phosphorylase/polyadenylase [Sulfitobacter indolifex HEL-45]
MKAFELDKLVDDDTATLIADKGRLAEVARFDILEETHPYTAGVTMMTGVLPLEFIG